jgi:acetyl esterase/lipase
MPAMVWAWVFLAASLVGLLFVANALWPRHGSRLSALSFAAAWPTAELPLWHIAWQAVVVAVFAALGALGSWPGWVALGLTLVGWCGLVVLAVRSQRAGEVLAEAARRVPVAAAGPDATADDLPRHGRDTMWSGLRLLYPLPRPARSVTVHRNIDYAGDGSNRHRLDVVVRRGTPPSGAPVVVHIHGGAWVTGDKREQGLPLLHELARRGWVGVTINYRLSPRATWPDQIVDCKRALAWVRANVAAYGGDPAWVAVTGGSAGGHLAALLALSPDDPGWQPGFEAADTSVDACVPMYGVYDLTGAGIDAHYVRSIDDLMATRVMKRSRAEAPETYRAASPICRVRAEAPPFLVIHGRNDTLVPVDEARRFVTELGRVSRAPVRYAELPGAQHAFDVLPSVRGAHAVAAVVSFLESVRRARGPRTDSSGARAGTTPAGAGAGKPLSHTDGI